MPPGFRFWRLFYLGVGALCAPLGLGMAITDLATQRPLDFRHFGGDFAFGAVGVTMMVASQGLRHMRKWGAGLMVLVPTAMMATIYCSGRPLEGGSALFQSLTTVFIAFGVLPHWQVMTWGPLPLDSYDRFLRKAPRA